MFAIVIFRRDGKDGLRESKNPEVTELPLKKNSPISSRFRPGANDPTEMVPLRW